MDRLQDTERKKGTLIIFILLIYSLSVHSQKPIATIQFESPIENAYVDRPGDLYVQLKNGGIRKLDVNGKFVSELKTKEPLSLFDPRDGSRAFTYLATTKTYSYAFFGLLNEKTLPEEFAIEPILACPSGDKNLWVFDQADWSLKRIDLTANKVLVDERVPADSLPSKLNLIYMREYQGFLFFHEKTTGLLIFNLMGKLLRVLKGDITNFNFLGEELYFTNKNRLIFYDLFDGSGHITEIDPKTKFVLLTDQRLYKIYENRVDIQTNP